MQFLTTVCIQSELVKMLKDSYIDEVSDLLRGGGGVLNSATDKKKPTKNKQLKKKTHKHGNCKVNVLRILSRYRYSEAKLYSHVTRSRGKSLSSKISSHGLTERFWERTWHPPLPQSPFYDHHMNDTFIPRDLLYRALILSMMAQPSLSLIPVSFRRRTQLEEALPRGTPIVINKIGDISSTKV